VFGVDWDPIRCSYPSNPLSVPGLTSLPISQAAYNFEFKGRGEAITTLRRLHVSDFENVREFLLETSHLYPEIGVWWDRRVRPSLLDETRLAVVAETDGRLSGLCIAKPGESAKICTMRLRNVARNRGIGKALILEAFSHLLRASSRRFHVTISEGAEEGSIPFFESLGFRRVAVQRNRYQRGLDEYVYACRDFEVSETVSHLYEGAIERGLFGMMPKENKSRILLMSLRPEFATLVQQGKKTTEFRRRFSTTYEGALILFYITKPVGEVAFMARIEKVQHAPVETLWQSNQHSGGVSKQVYDSYFSGNTHGYAIQLADVQPISVPLSIQRAQQLSPDWRAPQSFQIIRPGSTWLKELRLPVNL
jgi:predicted transcriptional regulator/ribosomal protein S18 acetylase RimI-like enzyme